MRPQVNKTWFQHCTRTLSYLSVSNVVGNSGSATGKNFDFNKYLNAGWGDFGSNRMGNSASATAGNLFFTISDTVPFQKMLSFLTQK